MRLFFIFLLLIPGCLESNSTEVVVENEEIDMSFTKADFQNEKSKWICYHPETDFHNRECVEDYYPKGCYVLGDSGKFCWLLLEEDCYGDISGSVLDSCKNAGYLR